MTASLSRWRPSRSLVSASLVIVFVVAASACAKAADSAKVLATVNGEKITEADVRKAAAEQFAQMDREYANNVHQLIETKLNEMVQDRMVAAEAKARGVSTDQVLAGITVEPVTDATVDAFYEQNKAQIPRPKEQVAAQIKAYLEQQGQSKAREAYFATLAAKYNPQVTFEPMRITVQSAGFPARGPAAAPVTIVEFSDFQCPYCSRLKPTIEQVIAKYPSQVRVVFRQYPLPMHANAEKAAEAALCAADQGKFWELHDAMFSDQGGLTVDGLKAKATAVGLDAAAFGSCLDSGSKAGKVKADIAEGSSAGVSGTPALFVNGRFINGAVPLEEITKVIEDELKRQPAKG